MLADGSRLHVVIPDVTRVAWREKRDEILAATPDVAEHDFVYAMTRQQYEDKFGTSYRKPGFLVRFVVAIFKIIPKFGPFKPLAFEPLTADMEREFLASFDASGERYQGLLGALRDGRVSLTDTDLDTGKPPAHGVNTLADKTYDELVEKLRRKKTDELSPELRRALAEHYDSPPSRTSSAGGR